MLGIALCGAAGEARWTGDLRATDFYTLKGCVERVLTELGVTGASFAPSGEPFLHPGKSADLTVGGERAGYLGLLRGDVAAALGIDELPVYVAELAVAPLAARALETVVFEDLVTFPAAGQDLAVVTDAGVPADEVLAVVRKAGGRLLRAAWVFDVYEGEQVPPGKRSLAIRLDMRAPDRTLSDKDIAGLRQKVVAALEREFGATLR